MDPYLLFAYIAVYFATIFLGNIGVFSSFWVAFRGGLGEWSVPAAIIIICLAIISADSFWYWLGWKLRGTAFGNWIKRRLPRSDVFESHIEQRGSRWMLFSKFISGANVPLLFSIGWTHGVPYRKFLKNVLLSLSIWLPIMLGLSYAVYTSVIPFVAVQDASRSIEFFVVGIVVFFLLQSLLVVAFKKVFRKNGKSGN